MVDHANLSQIECRRHCLSKLGVPVGAMYAHELGPKCALLLTQQLANLSIT